MQRSPSEPRSPIVPLLIAAVVMASIGGGGVLFFHLRAERAKERATAALVASRARASALQTDVAAANSSPEAHAPQEPNGVLVLPPQLAPIGTLPTVKVLANGDREVTLLDGLVVTQPREEQHKFLLLRAGERNTAGMPSGVLPDGSYIYENMPVTINQDGRATEVLMRSRVSKIDGPIVDTEGPGQTPH